MVSGDLRGRRGVAGAATLQPAAFADDFPSAFFGVTTRLRARRRSTSAQC